MAVTGNGASWYLSTGSTFSPLDASYSWAMWYYPLAAPDTGDEQYPFSFTDSTEAYDFHFAWNHATRLKSAVHREAGGSYITAQHPGSPAFGGWHHVAATYDATTLKLYYDGIEVASAAAAVQTNSVNPKLTVLAYKNGASAFDDGSVSMLALWSICLTPAEVLSLARGSPPSVVQNASIVSYNKLNTGSLTTTGNALTNHGATTNVMLFDALGTEMEMADSDEQAVPSIETAMRQRSKFIVKTDALVTGRSRPRNRR